MKQEHTATISPQEMWVAMRHNSGRSTFVATQPLSDVGHNAIRVVSSRRPPGFVGICQNLKGCPGYVVGYVALCKWQLMMMELTSDFCIGRALTHQYVD